MHEFLCTHEWIYLFGDINYVWVGNVFQRNGRYNDVVIIDENYRISPVGKISKTSLWWSLFFVNFAHWEWTECDTPTLYNDVMIIDENYRISRSSAIRTRDGDIKNTLYVENMRGSAMNRQSCKRFASSSQMYFF